MTKKNKNILLLLTGTTITCVTAGYLFYKNQKRIIDKKRELRDEFLSNIKCYAEYAIEDNNIMEITVEKDAFGVWRKNILNNTTGDSTVEILTGKELDKFAKYLYEVSDIAVRHIPDAHEGYGAMKLSTGSLVYIPGKDLLYLIPDVV